MYFILKPWLQGIGAENLGQSFMRIGIDDCHTASSRKIINAVSCLIRQTLTNPFPRLLKQSRSVLLGHVCSDTKSTKDKKFHDIAPFRLKIKRFTPPALPASLSGFADRYRMLFLPYSPPKVRQI